MYSRWPEGRTGAWRGQQTWGGNAPEYAVKGAMGRLATEGVAADELSGGSASGAEIADTRCPVR